MGDISPRHRSNNTAGYTDPPKELRDFHHNVVTDNLINCRSLNVCPIIYNTPLR